MKKTKRAPLKLSIETLNHLSLQQVHGGAEPAPQPLPSGCRAGCLTVLPGTVISKL
jgi:hypothetical protein